MSDPVYSESLSVDEQSLGFRLALVRNPRGQYAFSLPLVRAVVCPIRKGRRVIKTYSLSAESAYRCEEFGSAFQSGIADWKVVIAATADAKQLIEKARSGELERALTATTPTIPLQCPTCQKDFELEQDDLSLDGETACPHCGVKTPNKSFAAGE
ncbi:MAG: hypothetical protein QM754_16310 [Tepidisphaeraceae bacterium]